MNWRETECTLACALDQLKTAAGGAGNDAVVKVTPTQFPGIVSIQTALTKYTNTFHQFLD